MRVLVVAMLVSMLSGCVGVITLHNPTRTYTGEAVKPGGRGYCCSGSETFTRRDDVRAAWGEPDRTWREDGRDFWYYRQPDLAWAAVMPVLIVPLPLGIPTGHNFTTFAFEGERLVSAQAADREGLVALCGFFLNDAKPDTHFGCFAD